MVKVRLHPTPLALTTRLRGSRRLAVTQRASTIRRLVVLGLRATQPAIPIQPLGPARSFRTPAARATLQSVSQPASTSPRAVTISILATPAVAPVNPRKSASAPPEFRRLHLCPASVE